MRVHEKIQKALDEKNKKLAEQGEPEITEVDLAEAVFGGTGKNEKVKMRNIMTGATERFHPDWIDAICVKLDITPNHIFPVGGDEDLGCY